MGTIADKLNLLLNTKAAIKAAIIAKGQSVADGDAFSTYPAKIQAIETGIQLPTLTTPGAAADLLKGKQLIDADGNVLTGTMPEQEIEIQTISHSNADITHQNTVISAGYQPLQKNLAPVLWYRGTITLEANSTYLDIDLGDDADDLISAIVTGSGGQSRINISAVGPNPIAKSILATGALLHASVNMPENLVTMLYYYGPNSYTLGTYNEVYSSETLSKQSDYPGRLRVHFDGSNMGFLSGITYMIDIMAIL